MKQNVTEILCSFKPPDLIEKYLNIDPFLIIHILNVSRYYKNSLSDTILSKIDLNFRIFFKIYNRWEVEMNERWNQLWTNIFLLILNKISQAFHRTSLLTIGDFNFICIQVYEI